MGDTVVKGGATARLGTVEGGLRVGRKARIIAESGNKVLVTGDASFEGPVTIDCDFECGSLRVEGRGWGPGGDFAVRGNLAVNGSAGIDASVRVDGGVRAADLDVAGHLRSGPLESKRLRVGGHLTTAGSLKAETVDVGGHATVTGDVDLAGMKVGGHVDIGGGKIAGEATVRGHLKASRKLEYGRLRVYGRLRLPAGSSGEFLRALGKAEFEGGVHCNSLVVEGVGEAGGGCTADDVKVNGRLEVLGPLKAAGSLEVNGTLRAKDVQCGGLVSSGMLAAASVCVVGDAELAGEVETSRGLKANAITVMKGSGCKGPLVGERIVVGGSGFVMANWERRWAGQTAAARVIGRMTSVEDLHGSEVVVGSNSRCGGIFANRVELGKGCVVGRVTYVESFKMSGTSYQHEPSVKASRLPDRPL